MFCGVDLGSRDIKIVFQDETGHFAFKKIDSVKFYRENGKREENGLVVEAEALGLGGKPVTVVCTGYGRLSVRVRGAKVIPEVMAHATGASYMTGLYDFTLLDLGGQDSKVALVRSGKVVDFLANDRCAASTGRYLENMAAVLNISLDELGSYWQSPVELNSTCAIFGESELIGKIIEGYSIPELAAGVNYSIFKRIRPMLARLASGVVVFTGGVAKSRAIKNIIVQEMGVEVVVPERPEFAGATGCCVHARGGLGDV